ncbi:Zn-finger in ubiquitin-hydrolases and other protein, related [Neospora caninum Liverpool]|uniref:Zn-finger in ubiquitin-hydrolases and other protein, related n=1 Tax=Neospora caninum (strain Liverpool) TaxID=572307 RepID=F0VR59_NEOCL|nr:Zn-finger in ubiquitin-hydrolases and other protein, related [Neospora caninum Liverpool]CBZ56207.1 Zn-finger in ubiquitin-hydrolases and other protein, related [Neospora caninum Liverpool]CEL70969.1 TPA: Zn-finger in ubiquitin-hydrolases and other protein, related [Neospora caninum Liverpool]|eukprot:XP_003886232.1 Zn-finger in ubiquitin-hydrolases and other protein, related [Neospora caninum Liverpool]
MRFHLVVDLPAQPAPCLGEASLSEAPGDLPLCCLSFPEESPSERRPVGERGATGAKLEGAGKAANSSRACASAVADAFCLPPFLRVPKPPPFPVFLSFDATPHLLQSRALHAASGASSHSSTSLSSLLSRPPSIDGQERAEEGPYPSSASSISSCASSPASPVTGGASREAESGEGGARHLPPCFVAAETADAGQPRPSAFSSSASSSSTFASSVVYVLGAPWTFSLPAFFGALDSYSPSIASVHIFSPSLFPPASGSPSRGRCCSAAAGFVASPAAPPPSSFSPGPSRTRDGGREKDGEVEKEEEGERSEAGGCTSGFYLLRGFVDAGCHLDSRAEADRAEGRQEREEATECAAAETDANPLETERRSESGQRALRRWFCVTRMVGPEAQRRQGERSASSEWHRAGDGEEEAAASDEDEATAKERVKGKGKATPKQCVGETTNFVSEAPEAGLRRRHASPKASRGSADTRGSAPCRGHLVGFYSAVLVFKRARDAARFSSAFHGLSFPHAPLASASPSAPAPSVWASAPRDVSSTVPAAPAVPARGGVQEVLSARAVASEERKRRQNRQDREARKEREVRGVSREAGAASNQRESAALRGTEVGCDCRHGSEARQLSPRLSAGMCLDVCRSSPSPLGTGEVEGRREAARSVWSSAACYVLPLTSLRYRCVLPPEAARGKDQAPLEGVGESPDTGGDRIAWRALEAFGSSAETQERQNEGRRTPGQEDAPRTPSAASLSVGPGLVPACPSPPLSEAAPAPWPAWEIPACPVCLERVDETATGIFTRPAGWKVADTRVSLAAVETYRRRMQASPNEARRRGEQPRDGEGAAGGEAGRKQPDGPGQRRGRSPVGCARPWPVPVAGVAEEVETVSSRFRPLAAAETAAIATCRVCFALLLAHFEAALAMIRQEQKKQAEGRAQEEDPQERDAGLFRCGRCPEENDLWLCLICGHCGCGRYRLGHAKAHSAATRHRFCLHLPSGRIWDYRGDVFVHRLLLPLASSSLPSLVLAPRPAAHVSTPEASPENDPTSPACPYTLSASESRFPLFSRAPALPRFPHYPLSPFASPRSLLFNLTRPRRISAGVTLPSAGKRDAPYPAMFPVPDPRHTALPNPSLPSLSPLPYPGSPLCSASSFSAVSASLRSAGAAREEATARETQTRETGEGQEVQPCQVQDTVSGDNRREQTGGSNSDLHRLQRQPSSAFSSALSPLSAGEARVLPGISRGKAADLGLPTERDSLSFPLSSPSFSDRFVPPRAFRSETPGGSLVPSAARGADFLPSEARAVRMQPEVSHSAGEAAAGRSICASGERGEAALEFSVKTGQETGGRGEDKLSPVAARLGEETGRVSEDATGRRSAWEGPCNRYHSPSDSRGEWVPGNAREGSAMDADVWPSPLFAYLPQPPRDSENPLAFLSWTQASRDEARTGDGASQRGARRYGVSQPRGGREDCVSVYSFCSACSTPQSSLSGEERKTASISSPYSPTASPSLLRQQPVEANQALCRLPASGVSAAFVRSSSTEALLPSWPDRPSSEPASAPDRSAVSPAQPPCVPLPSLYAPQCPAFVAPADRHGSSLDSFPVSAGANLTPATSRPPHWRPDAFFSSSSYVCLSPVDLGKESQLPLASPPDASLSSVCSALPLPCTSLDDASESLSLPFSSSPFPSPVPSPVPSSVPTSSLSAPFPSGLPSPLPLSSQPSSHSSFLAVPHYSAPPGANVVPRSPRRGPAAPAFPSASSSRLSPLSAPSVSPPFSSFASAGPPSEARESGAPQASVPPYPSYCALPYQSLPQSHPPASLRSWYLRALAPPPLSWRKRDSFNLLNPSGEGKSGTETSKRVGACVHREREREQERESDPRRGSAAFAPFSSPLFARDLDREDPGQEERRKPDTREGEEDRRASLGGGEGTSPPPLFRVESREEREPGGLRKLFCGDDDVHFLHEAVADGPSEADQSSSALSLFPCPFRARSPPFPGGPGGREERRPDEAAKGGDREGLSGVERRQGASGDSFLRGCAGASRHEGQVERSAERTPEAEADGPSFPPYNPFTCLPRGLFGEEGILIVPSLSSPQGEDSVGVDQGAAGDDASSVPYLSFTDRGPPSLLLSSSLFLFPIAASPPLPSLPSPSAQSEEAGKEEDTRQHAVDAPTRHANPGRAGADSWSARDRSREEGTAVGTRGMNVLLLRDTADHATWQEQLNSVLASQLAYQREIYEFRIRSEENAFIGEIEMATATTESLNEQSVSLQVQLADLACRRRDVLKRMKAAQQRVRHLREQNHFLRQLVESMRQAGATKSAVSPLCPRSSSGPVGSLSASSACRLSATDSPSCSSPSSASPSSSSMSFSPSAKAPSCASASAPGLPEESSLFAPSRPLEPKAPASFVSTQETLAATASCGEARATSEAPPMAASVDEACEPLAADRGRGRGVRHSSAVAVSVVSVASRILEPEQQAVDSSRPSWSQALAQEGNVSPRSAVSPALSMEPESTRREAEELRATERHLKEKKSKKAAERRKSHLSKKAKKKEPLNSEQTQPGPHASKEASLSVDTDGRKDKRPLANSSFSGPLSSGGKRKTDKGDEAKLALLDATVNALQAELARLYDALSQAERQS